MVMTENIWWGQRNALLLQSLLPSFFVAVVLIFVVFLVFCIIDCVSRCFAFLADLITLPNAGVKALLGFFLTSSLLPLPVWIGFLGLLWNFSYGLWFHTFFSLDFCLPLSYILSKLATYSPETSNNIKWVRAFGNLRVRSSYVRWPCCSLCGAATWRCLSAVLEVLLRCGWGVRVLPGGSTFTHVFPISDHV